MVMKYRKTMSGVAISEIFRIHLTDVPMDRVVLDVFSDLV